MEKYFLATFVNLWNLVTMLHKFCEFIYIVGFLPNILTHVGCGPRVKKTNTNFLVILYSSLLKLTILFLISFTKDDAKLISNQNQQNILPKMKKLHFHLQYLASFFQKNLIWAIKPKKSAGKFESKPWSGRSKSEIKLATVSFKSIQSKTWLCL